MINRPPSQAHSLPPNTTGSALTVRVAQVTNSDGPLTPIAQIGEARSAARDPAETNGYRVAASRHELSAAFRLVYRSYRKAGLIDSSPYSMRVTRFHLHPETTVYVGVDGGEVVSTVTLIGDTAEGLPMDCIYYREVDDFRARGCRVAEVSCLASMCDPSNRRFLTTFVELNSLMAQSARLQGIDHLMIVVNPRHAPFYEKYVGFRSTGIVRPYPAVENHPALLLYLDLIRMHLNAPKAYQRFFGVPIPIQRLRPRPMSNADIDHFAPASIATRSFVPVPMVG